MAQSARIGGWVSRVSSALGIVSGVVVLVIAVLMTIDIVMRYFFNSPFIFTFEMCNYLLALAVFSSFAAAFEKGRQLRIEVFTERLPRRLQFWLRQVTLILGTIFTAIWAWQIFIFVRECYLFHRRSSVLRIFIWKPQLAMLVGVVMLFLVVLLGTHRHYVEGTKSRVRGTGAPETTS